METRFFLNISNHPSSKWGQAQWWAAGQIGLERHDIPFPEVDPTSDEMDALVDQVAAAVQSFLDEGLGFVAAMVAGEPVLTVRLVARLQSMGVDCYAATTRRVAAEKDGVKTSVFQFDHFRPFPRITLGA